MNQQKELENLEKRLSELSRTAYQRDIITYSDFLNLSEQNILHTLPKDRTFTSIMSFGGYEMAERQMAAFIPDALYLCYGKEEFSEEEISYPFRALEIAPLNQRFSEDLTHRDYLGAILNLGIERSRTGDILLKDKKAIVFAHNDVADYICSELNRVRHTSVKVTSVLFSDIDYTAKTEKICGTVASVRLDSLLSLAFSQSRNKLSGLIEGGKVYVNGRLIGSNSYQLHEEDVVSVRGMGKFRYDFAAGKTRKNRITVQISKYV